MTLPTRLVCTLAAPCRGLTTAGSPTSAIAAAACDSCRTTTEPVAWTRAARIARRCANLSVRMAATAGE
jgi:hypothetical protein